MYGGISLVVQRLRLHAPNAGDPCSMLDWGTESHMPQLRVFFPKGKDLTLPQLRPLGAAK